MKSRNTRSTADLLAEAFPASANEGVQDAQSRTLCAQLTLYSRTQYVFYVAFQALVLALAVAAAVVLIIFIQRLTHGAHITGAVGTLGGAVTGGVAIFLQKQASDAKKRYEAALSQLQNSGCP
jgi:hypothetical protein